MNPLDAAQDAYQAWLRAKSLACDAARVYLARADEESKRELEGLLAAEGRARQGFERAVDAASKTDTAPTQRAQHFGALDCT